MRIVSQEGTVRFGHRSKLRVVLVSTQTRWHGGEDQAALLAQGLHDRGHECFLLARQDGEFAQRMQARGWDVHTFSGRGRLPHVLWGTRRTLKQLRPDVLHFNDPHALTGAGLAALGLPIPLRIAARRVDFPMRSASRYCRLADHVICVSTAVREICHQAGIPSSRLAVVLDGVDPRRTQDGNRLRGRQALGLNDSTKLLLTVAKLTDHKGHRYFLDALPTILRRYPDTIWALAGDGSLRSSLEQDARRLGLEAHVRFLGYRHDVPDLLAAADRLLVPSALEGLCSSIIDAMFARCPVIATTAGGIPDLIAAHSPSDPAVAWLVRPCDGEALADAVFDSFEQPDQTAAQVQRAYQRARERFTAEAMIEQTLAVYENGLQRLAKTA